MTGRVTDWNSVVGNTRLLIAFGGIALRNTQITSGGAGDHPARLARARAAGMRTVIVARRAAMRPRRWMPNGCPSDPIPTRP